MSCAVPISKWHRCLGASGEVTKKGFSLGAVAWVLWAIVSGCGEQPTIYYFMTYREALFQGPSKAKIDRMFPAVPDRIPDLVVKTPAGEVFQLSDLPKAVVSKLENVRHRNEIGLDQYSCGETILQYRNGKLQTFTFGAGPLRVGADRKGPFLPFPMTSDEIRETFGRPEREGRASKSLIEWK